jgi:hypothetical protein
VLSLLLGGGGSEASLAQQGFEKTSVNAPPSSFLWFLGVAEQNTIKPGVRLWVRAIMRITGGIKKTFYFFRQTRYLDHGGSSQESMKEYLVSTSLYTPGETSQ